MKRYIIIGILVFLAIGVSFAPARLVDRALDGVPQVDLIEARGTLWRGQGDVFFKGVELGALGWDFHPLSLLSLSPTYDWQLSQYNAALSGSAVVSSQLAGLTVQGMLQSSALNEFVKIYDIYIDGRFDVSQSEIKLDHGERRITFLDGQIDWTGGLVRYTQSGQLREAQLPPMTVVLQMSEGGAPQAVAYQQGGSTPLIIASQGAPGFVKVGITKMFTKLLRSPWPGSDPDHEVVLEVEEQFF